jgi:hypothetical protein
MPHFVILVVMMLLINFLLQVVNVKFNSQTVVMVQMVVLYVPNHVKLVNPFLLPTVQVV